MKQIIFILTILTFFTFHKIEGQTLFKSWVGDSGRVCITFKEKGYSTISELDRVKFKLKKNKLIIYNYYNPHAVFGRRKKYVFYIELLTENTLILKQNVKKNQFEHIPGDTIKFTSALNGCTF
jgi:hypothetical protein